MERAWGGFFFKKVSFWGDFGGNWCNRHLHVEKLLGIMEAEKPREEKLP